MEQIRDVIIVGGGIAGYSAALTAKNLKLDYLWVGDKNFGKKTAKAEYVRNYPAFQGDGAEFIRALGAQKEAEGIVLTEKRIDAVYKEKSGFLLTAGDESFRSRTVILATGVELSASLGDEFLGRGVSYCAVCDGALYKNKRIAAMRGGNWRRRSIWRRLRRKSCFLRGSRFPARRRISAFSMKFPRRSEAGSASKKS